MSCSCIYIGESRSPTIVYFNKGIKASRAIICCECGRSIKGLERFHKYAGNWGGQQSTYNTCLDCVSVSDEFFCEGYAFTQLWRDVVLHVVSLRGEISSECLEDLTPRAKAMLVKLIDKALAIPSDTTARRIWEEMQEVTVPRDYRILEW